MCKYVIIVAGGSGTRMQSIVPKQFLILQGKPILMHSIEAFYKYDNTCKIILVLPFDQVEYWNELCLKFDFSILHKIVYGGNTRFQSVKNGLSEIDTNGIVAVHDGVRPLVSIETIQNCFETSKLKGNAVPVILVNDSIRKLEADSNHSLHREEYRLVQTPQCFDSVLLKKAYLQNYNVGFTDDASVIESLGININLVKGNLENIKITSPADLVVSEALLAHLNS